MEGLHDERVSRQRLEHVGGPRRHHLHHLRLERGGFPGRNIHVEEGREPALGIACEPSPYGAAVTENLPAYHQKDLRAYAPSAPVPRSDTLILSRSQVVLMTEHVVEASRYYQ